ncbi:MAG: hypothetical protein WCJ19_03995 [bacterium]
MKREETAISFSHLVGYQNRKTLHVEPLKYSLQSGLLLIPDNDQFLFGGYITTIDLTDESTEDLILFYPNGEEVCLEEDVTNILRNEANVLLTGFSGTLFKNSWGLLQNPSQRISRIGPSFRIIITKTTNNINEDGKTIIKNVFEKS